jgi:hypothetical protein
MGTIRRGPTRVRAIGHGLRATAVLPAGRGASGPRPVPFGAAVTAVRTLIHRHEKGWMSALSDAELGACIGLLHRIQDTLVAAPEAAAANTAASGEPER